MVIKIYVEKLDTCITLHYIVLAWGISIAPDVLQRDESVGCVSFKLNFQTALQLLSLEIKSVEVGVISEAE
jgi:hypothetical protein